MPKKGIKEALGAWQKLLGSERVLQGASILPYTQDTSATKRRILAVLKPRSVSEVQKIVTIAQKYKTPLYPLSTGKNWGYGTALPVVDSSVIVDLSLMKKIIEVDEALGFATIEPGVTQGMLSGYLGKRGLPWMTPITGSSPECSLIGNALERGFGINPLVDHFASITALEAVLPDGTIFKSSMEEMGGELINKIYRWGIGPHIESLFAQSNFGIVTKVTFALCPKYESLATFFVEPRKPEVMPDLIEKTREILATTGVPFSSVKFFNEFYMRAQGQNPHFIPPAWAGWFSIYGKKAVVQAAKKAIKSELKPLCNRVAVFSSPQLQLIQKLEPKIPEGVGVLKTKLRMLLQTYSYSTGNPTFQGLKFAYWKQSHIPPLNQANPAKDGCGILWFNALVPATGEHFSKCHKLVTNILNKHKKDPFFNASFFSPSCFLSVVPLFFDPASETDAAYECFNELLECCSREGFLPYRLPIHMQNSKKVVTPLAQKLKQALDPFSIIAPKRYGL